MAALPGDPVIKFCGEDCLIVDRINGLVHIRAGQERSFYPRMLV